MRIKTDKGYWVMQDYVRVKFFILKRDASKWIQNNKPIGNPYSIKKGTQSYKI